MKKLAWAKFKTPIIEKISVSPDASKNNSMPYSVPFKREKVMTSILMV
jgi:hypothetical protein